MNRTPPPPPHWALLIVALVLMLVALALIATGLQLTGLWRRKPTASENPPGFELAAEPPLTFQFGLRTIFLLTTVVALYVLIDKWLGWSLGRALLSGICLVLSLSVPAGWVAVLLMLITGGADHAQRPAGIMFLLSGAGALLAVVTLLAANW